MTIGSRIKRRREYLGMSQDDLAQKLGYKNRSSINKIELDKQNLRQSKIKAIADALDTTPAYIMGWEPFHYKSEEDMIINEIEYDHERRAAEAGISNEALDIAESWEKLDDDSKRQVLLMIAFLKEQQDKK